MDNPGAIQLTLGGNAFSVVGAGTQVGDWLDGLEGLEAAALQVQFLYGSGGTSVIVYIQTSLDQGATPIDIAAVEFTTAGGTEVVNLSALTPVTTPVAPTQQALSPGTCVNGILGDRLRAVVVSTGTYSGSLVNVTGCVR